MIRSLTFCPLIFITESWSQSFDVSTLISYKERVNLESIKLILIKTVRSCQPKSWALVLSSGASPSEI